MEDGRRGAVCRHIILTNAVKVEEVDGTASGILSDEIKLYVADTIGLSGGTLYSTDNTKVIIPSNALTSDALIGFAKSEDSTKGVLPYIKPSLRAINTKVPISYDFGKLNTSDNNNWVLESINFAIPVAIEIPYTIEDIGDLQEKELRIFRLEGAEWKIVEGEQYVDTSKHIVRANNVLHFSTYRIMGTFIGGDIAGIKVYPNPYRPSSVYEGKLKTVFLPKDCEMKIYNIAGELIKTLNEVNFGNNGFIEWDGRNESGEEVGQGVYIYVIKDSNGNKKVGKIGLIR